MRTTPTSAATGDGHAPIRHRHDHALDGVAQAGGTITLEDTETVFTSAAFCEGLPDITVAQVMRVDVASVRPSKPAVDAMRQLVAATFIGLAVVDHDGGLSAS